MTTAAARIADRVHRAIAARARTVPAIVVDLTPLPDRGFWWATIGTSATKVFGRPLDLIHPGDMVFVRKMTHDRASFWVYDSFGQHPRPDGTARVQPLLDPGPPLLIIPDTGPAAGGTLIAVTTSPGYVAYLQSFTFGATIVTVAGALGTGLAVVDPQTVTVLTPPGVAGPATVAIGNSNTSVSQIRVGGFTYV